MPSMARGRGWRSLLTGLVSAGLIAAGQLQSAVQSAGAGTAQNGFGTSPPPAAAHLQWNSTLMPPEAWLSPVLAEPREFCVTCPVALDWETYNILDWIAFHTLLGVDCFVLFIDMSHMTTVGSKRVLEQLRTKPQLIYVLEVTNIQVLQPLAANLQWQMVRRNTRVEFLAYLDADEVLTWPGGGVNDSSNDSPIQSATPPPSILPMLRATIGAETGNGAMYLHRWELSTPLDAPITAQMADAHPAAFYKTATSTRAVGRSCVENRYVWGKLIGRVHSGARMSFMHQWVPGPGAAVVLPSGRAFNSTDGGSLCDPQPLSITHYSASLQQCLAKVDHSHVDYYKVFENGRTEELCCYRHYNSVYHLDGHDSAKDQKVAVFADVTRVARVRLFPSNPTAVESVGAVDGSLRNPCHNGHSIPFNYCNKMEALCRGTVNARYDHEADCFAHLASLSPAQQDCVVAASCDTASYQACGLPARAVPGNSSHPAAAPGGPPADDSSMARRSAPSPGRGKTGNRTDAASGVSAKGRVLQRIINAAVPQSGRYRGEPCYWVKYHGWAAAAYALRSDLMAEVPELVERFDVKWSVAWARTESVVSSSGTSDESHKQWSVTSTKKKSTEAHLARPGSPIERARRVARLERW